MPRAASYTQAQGAILQKKQEKRRAEWPKKWLYFLFGTVDSHKKDQPAIKHSPPMGVIGPTQLTPTDSKWRTAKRYNEPLKQKIPAIKNPAATGRRLFSGK